MIFYKYFNRGDTATVPAYTILDEALTTEGPNSNRTTLVDHPTTQPQHATTPPQHPTTTEDPGDHMTTESQPFHAQLPYLDVNVEPFEADSAKQVCIFTLDT